MECLAEVVAPKHCASKFLIANRNMKSIRLRFTERVFILVTIATKDITQKTT